MAHKKKHALCYLRTHRRLWGLTQQDLAGLMGFQSAGHVSRIENGKRDPTIETALACEVLFGVSPSVMFPQAYDAVEERVMRDIHRLDGTLSDTSAVDLRKRELLSSAFARAITRPNAC
uniref:Helix-turn-helix domain protein n=1 Tax=mine drainage metagenome TaxID=410659 RepID=E6QWT1_9ZZZZ